MERKDVEANQSQKVERAETLQQRTWSSLPPPQPSRVAPSSPPDHPAPTGMTPPPAAPSTPSHFHGPQPPLQGTGPSIMAYPPQQQLHYPNEMRETVARWTGFREKSLLETYLLALSPFGILGAHHFYLQRPYWGVLYFFTFGLLGCGYVIDWFRVPWLVREANAKHSQYGQNREDKKNICDAYTLWFPFGLLGFHHYYLGNFVWGVVYTLTLGLFGIGWLIDLFRIPRLVRETNERNDQFGPREKGVCEAYVLGFPPAGILGLHHYYLNRPIWGMVYTFTLGLLGVGWLSDCIRMRILVERANLEIKGSRPRDQKTLDDAYILWFPFGLMGLHHFYLGRPVWGLLYFFSLGLLGIGWLIDGCRMPWLVTEANQLREGRALILPTSGKISNSSSSLQGSFNRGAVNYGLYASTQSGQQASPPLSAPVPHMYPQQSTYGLAGHPVGATSYHSSGQFNPPTYSAQDQVPMENPPPYSLAADLSQQPPLADELPEKK